MERREDAARLQRLVSAYQPELLRVCYFYLKDRMLAEDAVQETFMRVWRKLDSYHEDGREKAWIYRIAINCCRNTQRTGWFRRMLPTGEPQLFPREDVTVPEDAIALNMAIHDLPLPRNLPERLSLTGCRTEECQVTLSGLCPKCQEEAV